LTCELKRIYVSSSFRLLGLGQKLLDTAIDFAKSVGYSRMFLDSSKMLYAARALYLKNGFADIPRYNDNYRADVCSWKQGSHLDMVNLICHYWKARSV